MTKTKIDEGLFNLLHENLWLYSCSFQAELTTKIQSYLKKEGYRKVKKVYKAPQHIKLKDYDCCLLCGSPLFLKKGTKIAILDERG